jgi:hypothetical protein
MKVYPVTAHYRNLTRVCHDQDPDEAAAVMAMCASHDAKQYYSW